MRRSPRRPLILKRRKLPFQQNEAAVPPKRQPSEPPNPAVPCCFPSGIRILDHPSMSDTQVVVIPTTADLQSVIGALTAKGKERGSRGPNKFILLSGNDGRERQPESAGGLPGHKAEAVPGSPNAKSVTGIKEPRKDRRCSDALDDSLTSMQWLGKFCDLEKDSSDSEKENRTSATQTLQTLGSHGTGMPVPPQVERPPYSYMAMIQFAINSRNGRRMTLKEIYTWIEDHFPYYRDVAKPGWKNSIRHNLSLHDMFIRETSPDGKVSFWTIRPEANRCLTLDQTYKPGCDPTNAPVPVPMLVFPHQQKNLVLDPSKAPTTSERRMKPLLPRTDSYLVPVHIPVAPQLYLPPASVAPCSEQKRSVPRGSKKVRIAPKVTQAEPPATPLSPQWVKEEPVCVPVRCETPKGAPRRPSSSSRRKQRLVRSLHEEPVLLCPDTFLDSGVASDLSTFHDGRDPEPEAHRQDSPDRDFSFKTPIKGSSHLTSSTPSKPPCGALPEPWRVTPVGKGSQTILDFSPVRTPHGDFSSLTFSSTPFKELPLFNSPRELLASAEGCQRSCSRELLQPGLATPTNRSMAEGLVLDTMNDSLSKILVDISFPGLEDEDLGMANISWSEFFPQLK